jgi:glucans biosynthesis protein
MDKIPVDAMRLAPRCGARTRRGTPCQGPAMANGRCRMHSGNNPGPPRGNRNAWKHGLRSGEMDLFREMARMLKADLKAL